MSMKWFQVDSDTPHDPRIVAVLEKFGNAGLGMLLRLWCFVASQGKRLPGWSCDSSGKPIPKEQIRAAIGAAPDVFDAFLDELTRSHHVSTRPWKKHSLIHLPAMSRRADTYTKRSVRTMFEHSSNNVRVQDKQDKQTKTPLPPLKGGRVTRADFFHAQEVRRRVYGTCPHAPRCARYDDCVRAIALERKNKLVES